MDDTRKTVGFIQLVLLICLVNNALCHYVPEAVNSTDNNQHHRSRRDIDRDEKICDALDATDNAGSIISMIPFIGPIFDTAVTVAKFGLKTDYIETDCDSLPFEDIKNKMNERFDKLDEKVERNFVAIHQLYTEIHRLFDELTDSIRDARIQPVLSEMKMFIEGFSMYQSKIDGYFEDGYFEEIDEILDDLKDAIKPTGGLLSTPVNDIINQNFAIPEDGDDRSGMLAFNALYYGVQTYASVLSFLLEKHTLLAEHHYTHSDNENYNKELRMIKVLFSNIKDLTATNSNEFDVNYGTNYDQNTLIDRFFNVAQLAIRRIKVQRRDSDKPIIDSINEKIEGMKKTNNEIAEMVLPIMKETPTLGAIKILKPEKDAGRLRKLYPLSGTVEQVWVMYAMQYRRNQSYSVISDWTTEYIIGEKKYATIDLPFAETGTVRYIFRHISALKDPELAGIIEDASQTSFNDLNRDLYNAASETTDSSNKIISRLIANGADVNSIFDEERSPLHAAAEANNIKAVNVLLQTQNIKVNIQDENGYSPLHVAAEFGHYEICELLLKEKADVNIKTFVEGIAPLHMAALSEQKSIVELLMKSPQINVNLGDTNGDTSLHYAANKSQSVVEAMIANANVDVNAKNNHGFTPLHYAVSNKIPDVVSTFLSNQNVNVNALSNTKLSPLHQASLGNAYEMAELLVAHKGVNINVEGPEGLRPIHFAAMAGHKDLLKLLADNNADLNAKSNTHWTALHFAVALREGDTVSMLLSLKSSGLDVNSKSDEGYTPLHMAVASPQYQIIEDLIKEGANLEAVTNDGLTPLHIAAMHNDVQVVNILLKSGANKQAKTPQGKLVWELAVEKGNLEVVKYVVPEDLNHAEQKRLLNAGAEPSNFEVLKYLIEERKYKCEWADLENILYTSINNNRTETSKYLIDSIIEIYGNSELQYLRRHFVAAARAENFHTVKYLEDNQKLKFGYTVYHEFINFVEEYVDKNGITRKRTALHEAVYAGNRPIIEYLMRCMVEYTITDEQGKTAVDVAKEKGVMDVYRMLKVDGSCKVITTGGKNVKIETEFINQRCYDSWDNLFSHPLNIAITHDNDVSNDLISDGASVNTPDDNGDTPLHIALAHKKFQLAELILTKNADVRIKNNKNQKPIDVAREYDAPENIISTLINMENQLNQKDGFPM